MVESGFAVAAINYRLMPEHPFPAEIQDAKCASTFPAGTFEGLQPGSCEDWDMGGSAGGHLAAMVGLTNGEPEFEAGEYLDQSSEVAAVVEMFGPMDLTMPMDWLQRVLLKRAFNTTESDSTILFQASPVNYITGDDPSFLILHGEEDSAVPLPQAELFYRQLVESGVDASLVIVKNANHNFKPTGGSIEPTRQEISKLTADFFVNTLQ